MDKYLLEILKSANTIIIPGLGALTITNHDTGEIMFMSYLKHDDGKLVGYIVENEGMNELDAKNLIAKYVREIELTVGKGETYDMFQFGSFFKNGDEIDFKNWEGDKSSVTTEKVEEKETIVAPIIEETPIVEEKEQPIVTESKEVEEITPPKVEEVKEEKQIKEEKIEPVVLHLKEEKPEKELNILEKEERAATAAKLEVLRKNKESKSEKKKKGVGFWMLIVLLVLMAGGGTYFGLNYDELKQHVPFLADTKTVSINSTAETEDSSNNDNSTAETENNSTEEIESEVIEEEIPEQIEPEVKEETTNFSNSNNDLPFHIIAGAFSSEENANRLGKKLKAEGYNVKVGPGAGMTLVSIKSFATKAEAQAGLNEVKSVAPKGWIFEWK